MRGVRQRVRAIAEPLRRPGVAAYPLDLVLRRTPPHSYRLEDYKRWFATTASTFLRAIRRSGLPDGHALTGDAIGIVVVPWVSTPVPWYSIMLGIGFARRGQRVVLLWDDTGFPELHLEEQQRLIAGVLERVRGSLPIATLTEAGVAPSRPGDDDLVTDLTDQNVTWTLRGAHDSERQPHVEGEISESLGESLPRIRDALDQVQLRCLVVPGGVYGTSGLFAHEASARGIRVATFDTDRRIPQICCDGVAAQNADIPRAFELVWNGDAAERARAVEVAREEFESRVANRDGYGFQALPASGRTARAEGAVVMPMNVEWDTAALGRHHVFDSTVDWVTSTVAAILERDAGPVIVRQHPSERRKLQRSQLDIASAIRDRVGDDPRCQFVAAEDPVNSYDLLRSARLVLPYVSTIAIEAAAMGKPVLISGRAYYAGLGFVWSVTSRDEYFELLERGLRGDLGLRPEQVDRAWICYYLAAVRNRIASDFTSHPDDFWHWTQRHFDELFDEPEVQDILDAIDHDVPVSYLRHRRAWREEHGSAS